MHIHVVKDYKDRKDIKQSIIKGSFYKGKRVKEKYQNDLNSVLIPYVSLLSNKNQT